MHRSIQRPESEAGLSSIDTAVILIRYLDLDRTVRYDISNAAGSKSHQKKSDLFIRSMSHTTLLRIAELRIFIKSIYIL